MAIGAGELGVNVQEGLHDILPRGQVAEAVLPITGDAVVHHDALAGRGAADFLAKEALILQARLRLVGAGNEEKNPPGQGRFFVTAGNEISKRMFPPQAAPPAQRPRRDQATRMALAASSAAKAPFSIRRRPRLRLLSDDAMFIEQNYPLGKARARPKTRLAMADP